MLKFLRILLFLSLSWMATTTSSQSPIDVFEASITDLQTALTANTITSVELVEQYLARIAAYDQQGPALNSIVRINPQALAQAAALDVERQRAGARSALHGIPVVLKDNYNTSDMPTTGSSVALAGFVPNQNATQVERLLAAGAIVLAKTNLHEYAYGITSISSLQGQTRNPYDPRRVPGGSSGGTAAAVAASFAAIGMGSDTCGSIRIPAAFNNLIGLRPTKGLSSIYGIMPLSHTQDVGGPLARSAEDLAILLDVVVGYDSMDSATEIMRDGVAPGFHSQLGAADLSQLRIGQLSSYMAAADSGIRQQIEQALDWFAARGATIVEIDIPELGALIARSGVIGYEFKDDLDAYLTTFGSAEIGSLADIVDAGLYHQAVQGALVRSRNTTSNADAYNAALAARHDLRAAIEQFMQAENLDAIAYPPIAELQVFVGENQPGNNCSISANSGLPALSLPVGFTDSGLPVGLELLGGFMDDARLLSLGYAFEQGNSMRQPPATTPPLQNGVAPAPTVHAIDFNQAGIRVQGSLAVDFTTNQLQADLTLTAAAGSEVHAVTVVIADDNTPDASDPVVYNLSGPARSDASSTHVMTPAFRAAYTEQRVYIKVFASSLPATGQTYQLP